MVKTRHAGCVDASKRDSMGRQGSFNILNNGLRVVLLLCGTMLLTGCAWLPSAGPSAATVLDQSRVHGYERYVVVPVDYAVLNTLLREPAPDFQTLFGGDAVPPQPTISVGDAVVVSIWEAGGGTLFSQTVMSTNGMVPMGSHQVTIPEQVVMTDGAISVPFAGRIVVAGHTPLEVQAMVRRSLLDKATDPQVIVAITRSTVRTVTVTGEAVVGARVPVAPKGDRVLDVIAAAGGIKTPTFQTYVRLTRGTTTAIVPFTRLIENPKDNVVVWPGDTVTVTLRAQHFSAFGATGQNAEFAFDEQTVSLAQALAKSAGLIDDRADPAGVFLLRFEPRALAAKLSRATPAGASLEDMVPVIYQMDFRDMQSYFLAQRFPMKDNDVLYIASARSNSIRKFFQLFGTLTAPVVTGAAVNNSVH